MAGYGAYMGGAQMVGSLFDKYINYSQARAFQQDMNEYNSPVNQVARLRQAGISSWAMNPDGNTSAQPVLSGDQSIGSAIGSSADREIARRQVDAQVNLSNAQAKQTESQTRTIDTLLNYLDESERERIDNLKASTGNLNASTSEIAKRLSRYDEQVDQQIKLQKSQETAQYASSDKCKAETFRINRMLNWEIKEAQSRIIVNSENVAVLRTQAGLNTKQIEHLATLINKDKSEIDRIGLDNWIKKREIRILNATGVRPGTPAWIAVTDVINNMFWSYKERHSPGSW